VIGGLLGTCHVKVGHIYDAPGHTLSYVQLLQQFIMYCTTLKQHVLNSAPPPGPGFNVSLQVPVLGCATFSPTFQAHVSVLYVRSYLKTLLDCQLLLYTVRYGAAVSDS
jgi:hypothetical protein